MSSVPRWQPWSEIFMISVHVKSALSRSWAIHTGQTEAASLRQRTYHKTAHYCLNSGSEPSANDNESLRARRHAQLHAEPCGPTEMQILRRHQCWLEEWFEKVDWKDKLMPLTMISNRRSALHQGAVFSPIQGNPVSLTNLTNYTAKNPTEFN